MARSFFCGCTERIAPSSPACILNEHPPFIFSLCKEKKVLYYAPNKSVETDIEEDCMRMRVAAFVIVAGVFLQNQAVAATQYEAENATLTGGAARNTNHSGYSGTGFVDGYYYSTTALTTFTVNMASAGNATITLRYSAGNGASTNTGFYVNGTKIKNLSCNTTSNWNIWANVVETVTLNAGNNTIAYKSETSTNRCINLDYILVQALTTTYALTVTANAATYASGTVVMLTAVPATGYQFTGWSGDLTGTMNPATITMNSAKTVTANFTAIPSSTGAVTYAEISSPVTVTANNTTVLALPFTAPSAGYITVTATGLYGTTQAYTHEQRGLESFITLNSTSGGSLSGFVDKPNVQNGAQYVSETAGFPVSAGSNTVRLIVSPRTTLVSTTYKFVKCKMTVVFSQQKM